jgi:hypothetical protein
MIKAVFVFLFFVFSITPSFGQYVLDTPDGKRVKLNKNGTWEFVKKVERPDSNLPVLETSSAKFVDKYNKYTVWYDPAEWSCDTNTANDALDWDASFYSKDRAINGYWMSTRLAYSASSLESTIRQQWDQSGTITSLEIIRDTLNSLPVTRFEMLLDFDGITYQYRGYFYSTLKGSFQFIVGTQKEVFEEDKAKIELLFKGVRRL